VKAYNNSCFVPTSTNVAVRCVRFQGIPQAEAFNNILYAPNASSRFALEGSADASGANLTPSSNPFVGSSPSKVEDFALRAGNPAIASGVRVPNPIDYRIFPRTLASLPDVGALAFGSGVVVDAPPQPPVLLSVDVLP
jgi:hypothetical protein